MLPGSKALSSESLKFSLESFGNIKMAEQNALSMGVSFTTASTMFSCKFPQNTLNTPEKEFCRNKVDKSQWALFEHGKFVCSFTEEVLDLLKTTRIG